MPRDIKQSQDREYEGNAELDRERDQQESYREYDGGGDELDDRAEEARNPVKREEYKADAEAALDDLEDMEGPDA